MNSSYILSPLVLLVFLWGFSQVYGSVPVWDGQDQGEDVFFYGQTPLVFSHLNLVYFWTSSYGHVYNHKKRMLFSWQL